MDSLPPSGEAATAVSNAFGGYTTGGEDETSLWLRGAGGGDSVTSYLNEDEGLLASLSEGANLMSAGGGWSLGEDGLQWSGVKTEQVFDAWAAGSGGRQQAAASELVMKSSPLLLGTSTAAAVAGKGSSTGDDFLQSLKPSPLASVHRTTGNKLEQTEKEPAKYSAPPPPSSERTVTPPAAPMKGRWGLPGRGGQSVLFAFFVER